MPRPLWTGAISFGLVSIPIKVISATEDRSVHFHQVHLEDMGRVRTRKVCSIEDEVVPQQDQLRLVRWLTGRMGVGGHGTCDLDGCDHLRAGQRAGRPVHRGRGPYGPLPVCYDTDRDAAVARAHDQFRWSVGSWKVNAELPGPAGFARVSQFVRPDDIANSIPCGDDVGTFVEAVRPYAEAGFTEIALAQPAVTISSRSSTGRRSPCCPPCVISESRSRQ